MDRRAFAPRSTMYGQPRAYFLILCNGTVFGAESLGAAYGPAVQTGSVVACHHDRSTHSLSFSVDGICYGIAFSNLPAAVAWYPVVLFRDSAAVSIF